MVTIAQGFRGVPRDMFINQNIPRAVGSGGDGDALLRPLY
jgi:hypothetical protein